jgi:hypothetical protein
MIEDTLPSIPSDLLQLALDDLIKCENDPNYTIRMAEWYDSRDETCVVCLAGSVLAKTLNFNRPNYHMSGPEHLEEELPDSLIRKLRALNFLRAGSIQEGLRVLGIAYPVVNFPQEQYYGLYEILPLAAKEGIRRTIQWLKEHGL